MRHLFCSRCKGNVHVPDVAPALRAEIAALRFADQSVQAYERLAAAADMDLRLAKRLVIHLPHNPGTCHRCKAELQPGELVECPICHSVNVGWSVATEEAA